MVIENQQTFLVIKTNWTFKCISSRMASQYTFSERLCQIDTVSSDNMTLFRRRLTLTGNNSRSMTYMLSVLKGNSHPSLDDRWEFCWDRVLDAKEAGDDEENLHRCIPTSGWIFPNFLLWPRPKHSVVLCLLGHMVCCIIYGRDALSFQDYMDFMRTARWKIIRGEKRM
jgi:hypothetical protein